MKQGAGNDQKFYERRSGIDEQAQEQCSSPRLARGVSTGAVASHLSATWLQHDAIAGVPLRPTRFRVARLCHARGLPPQYGIYCYLVGGLFYALFGSSRQLAIGPTSAISMLVGVRSG